MRTLKEVDAEIDKVMKGFYAGPINPVRDAKLARLFSERKMIEGNKDAFRRLIVLIAFILVYVNYVDKIPANVAWWIDLAFVLLFIGSEASVKVRW